MSLDATAKLMLLALWIYGCLSVAHVVFMPTFGPR
jgi:hypothetical protein